MSTPPENDIAEMRRVLMQTFGYNEFRTSQELIIRNVLAGGDTMVLLPTGGGKSLCYQIPAIVRRGVGIVISPLLSLMKNQVDILQQNGVRAARLDSTQSAAQTSQTEAALLSSKLEILYVSPERALTERFMGLIKRSTISLFAIDEAHCVSQWGHDFRPEYIRLGTLYDEFAQVPRIALTATADNIIRREIIEKLQLRSPKTFTSSFNRPNIHYLVREKSANSIKILADFMRQNFAGKCAIVYCRTRADVETYTENLAELGFNVVQYHAGLDKTIRLKHQERFQNEEDLIVVATIAFGMGIDKPNVRLVAHMSLPKSIEAYYQETGRAGRDGEAATALLFYGLSDMVKNGQMIEQSEAPENIKQRERDKLKILLGFAEAVTCRRHVILDYFGEQADATCNNCDNCLNPPQTIDGTIPVQKLLSCAVRTGEIFGMGHLIDVLTGKVTDKVTKFHHKRLSTFNIGDEFNRAEWNACARQSIAAGLLSPDGRGHGSLMVTTRGRQFLHNRENFKLRKREVKATSRTTTRTAERQTAAHMKSNLSATDSHLFEALRTQRRLIATNKGFPPFVILHDATLVALAATKPRTLDELANISGFGAYKLDEYGTEFLAIIEQHTKT